MMDMPTIPEERIEDLLGFEFRNDADLVAFMAGNQFMAVPELLDVFKGDHRQCNRIFCETLPPGLEYKQIVAGGALFRGEVITGRPDCFTSVSQHAMEDLKARGIIDDYKPYLKNRLVIMVKKGNPKGIKSVEDLARDDVIISQPGELEHISTFIKAMYIKTGGKALHDKILKEKAEKGTTIFTTVHHRETPRNILDGKVDCGPCWATEAIYAERQGMDLEAVEVGEAFDQREAVLYFAATLRNAPHPECARAFFDFLFSDGAKKVFKTHGFLPV